MGIAEPASDAAPRCRSCTQRARATTMMEVMKNMLAGRERSDDDEGGLEEAKRELTELHRIMQSLEQEAKVFEGVYLPLDELKRSLEEGKEQEAIRQGLMNTSPSWLLPTTGSGACTPTVSPSR